ncbi:hypothetical protein [Sphingomonas montana]|uniref:hypothetical protein n=1 Tax=Sphingomonas montana TaxID=1843236 RepID=UPI00096FB4F6|nr:hypothetical protein [Sphingomonas montana]
MDDLAKARVVAGRHLADRGYDAEARIVLAGDGDDFAEVRIALQIIGRQAERTLRLEAALAVYAAPAFWDDDGSGATDAAHDAGSVARHALAGTNPPTQSYD